MRHQVGPDFTLDLSISIGTGITVVLGKNGAGKTSLIKILATADKLTSGRFALDGIEPNSRRSLAKVRTMIGWLPQTFGYDPHSTVSQFVTYNGWLRGMNKVDLRNGVERVLMDVDLTSRADSRMKSLSGGMLRRVGIAQALISDPALLLLDEPTAGLDMIQRADFYKVIREMCADRVVVLSTHLAEDVVGLADSILVLKHGTVALFDSRKGGRDWDVTQMMEVM